MGHPLPVDQLQPFYAVGLAHFFEPQQIVPVFFSKSHHQLSRPLKRNIQFFCHLVKLLISFHTAGSFQGACPIGKARMEYAGVTG